MAFEVTMPKLGLTMTEGVLTRWLVADGAEVKKGQPIFEIETDKVVNESPADADGILRVVAQAGSTVQVMGLVGYILAPGEEMPLTIPTQPDVEKAASAPPARMADSGRPNAGRRLASPSAKRRAQELGVDISQVQGTGEGGRITAGDVEVFAEAQGKAKASPLAKRMARQAGLDLVKVLGTGPGGRITKEDVERAIAQGESVGVVPAHTDASEGKSVPLSGVRAVIAERMLASSRSTAGVTLTSTVVATDLVAMRARLNQELGDQLGFRFAYNDVLIKVLATALKEFPYMNAHLEREAVRLLPYVHIGLAVDTERGLVVVVVRDADQKSIQEIARETRDKTEGAMTGSISPDDLSGGTFTLTNLGAFGIEAFTPIINPPEVAVLGVGRIEEVPVAYQGKVALRHRMSLSLTFDHRWVDGAPAARFLQRVGELIEKPQFLAGNQFG
jgi:pyruvate dehydrogenase E2 component (dihydrolipoamide acetyltransferase)